MPGLNIEKDIILVPLPLIQLMTKQRHCINLWTDSKWVIVCLQYIQMYFLWTQWKIYQPLNISSNFFFYNTSNTAVSFYKVPLTKDYPS